MRLPGTRLLELARHVIDPLAITRVLEPLVADWQREWLTSGSSTRRALARVRGLTAFLTTIAYCVLTDPTPPAFRRGARNVFLTFGAIGIVILLLPLALEYVPLQPITSMVWMLALLLPGALALSVPFAALPLAMQLGSTRRYSPAGARHLIRLTVAVVALVFVTHNWVTPYANRAFRTHALTLYDHHAVDSGRPPGLGARELTLPELFTIEAPAPGIIASPRHLHEERHVRASISLIPIVLAFLGWSLTRVARSTRLRRLVFWWVFAAMTYGFGRDIGMTVERAWDLPREIGIWLPLALWLAGSATLTLWHRRESNQTVHRA